MTCGAYGQAVAGLSALIGCVGGLFVLGALAMLADDGVNGAVIGAGALGWVLITVAMRIGKDADWSQKY